MLARHPYARRQALDPRARAYLEASAVKAQEGKYIEALADLRKGYAESLPADTRRLYQDHYLECYAQAAADRVKELAGRNGWRRIGTVTTAVGDQHDKDIAGRIAYALGRESDLSPSLRHLSSDGFAQLTGGVYHEVPSNDRALVAQLGDDALVTTSVGAEITTFVVDARDGKTFPALTVPNLPAGAAAAGTDIGDADWDLLPTPAADDFQVAAWTDKPSYRIGEPVTLSIRSNRRCHIAVFNTLATGEVVPFIPILEGHSDLALPGRVYTVPNSHGLPFPLRVRGPAGAESFKIIATDTPLDLAGFLGQSLPAADCIEYLGTSLGQAAPGTWTLTDCTIEVRN